jgi:hypothetical protein
VWIKIMKDDLRVCHDCRQFCIKYSCFDDAVEDDEEFGICDECVEQSLSSPPRQHHELCGQELGICRSLRRTHVSHGSTIVPISSVLEA